ncbi:MAG: MATE family efflux transporter [Eubacteriales bacterium]|nr:MATE family efflux transporter [Eubacteriales bacterium]
MKIKSILAKRYNRWEITDKIFFSLLLTGSIIEFSQVGAGFIDGLIISRFLGPEAMAAEGIAHPIFSILGIVSGLLSVGMEVRCTQAIGRGNRKEFSKFVSVTVYVGAVLSFIAAILVLSFSRPLAILLGASGNAENLTDPAAQYLSGIGIGVPALIMVAILAPALQIDSGSKTVQTGALIGAVSNVFLDLIAVKLNWGIFGIGISTSVATYLNLLYQCTFFLRKDRILHFVKPDVPLKDFIQMLVNGGEKAIKRLSNTIRPIVLNSIIISYGGAVAMSVLSIRNNFSDFVEIFGAGIASAVSLLIGVYYGEINEEAIREVSSFEHKMILLFSGSLCVLMLIFARPIARLYITEDGEILNMTVFVIRVLALQNPLQALISSRIKYLQAIHRKLNMNLLIVATKAVFVILSAVVLGKIFGIYGILASYTVSDALSLLAIYVYYAVKTRRVFPTKKDFQNLPEYFYLHPGDVISFDLRNLEDVSLASEQIILFCRGHKLDNKTAYYAALSFEELASNIVEHGFPSNKSSHPIIDLRVVISGNSFVIRLRDNCRQFDVTSQIAAANENDSDPTHNIGIRIVSKLASEITYLNTFNTNDIIIRFDLSEPA